MNNSNPSNESRSLISDVLEHLTTIKSLKQLFITVVLVSNIAMLYDLILNQAKGLESILNAYLSLYPTPSNPIISDQEVDYITEVVSRYPGSSLSLFEIVTIPQVTPVGRIDKSQPITIYDKGYPVAIIAISPETPEEVVRSLYYYFKGYEEINNSVLEPTLEPIKP